QTQRPAIVERPAPWLRKPIVSWLREQEQRSGVEFCYPPNRCHSPTRFVLRLHITVISLNTVRPFRGAPAFGFFAFCNRFQLRKPVCSCRSCDVPFAEQ